MNQHAAVLASWAAAAVAVLAALPAVLSNPAAPVPAPSPSASDDLQRHVATLGDDFDAARRAVADLTARVGALEERRRPVAATSMPQAPDKADAPPSTAADAAGANAPPPPERLRTLRANLPRMFRHGLRDCPLSEQEQHEFWSLARTPGTIDTLLQEQENKVSSSPTDVAARLELADLYTAKLLTIPGGPEKGVWSSKAERQWQAVIEQDPNHWEARFLLGFNYSMYPAFVDRSKEAIEHLETARTLQQPLPAEPRQVDVYAGLARMYARQRRHDRARAVLAEGLARFPDDETLRRAQEQIRN